MARGIRGKESQVSRIFVEAKQALAQGKYNMYNLPSFVLETEKGYIHLSFDIKSGYSHFYWQSYMRDFFLVLYSLTFYLCLSLPFGSGLSHMCFTKIQRGLLRHLWIKCGNRVLPWVIGCYPT